jgi:hypothetical protein
MAGEMMSGDGGSHSRVDADKQDPQAGPDAILEAQAGPIGRDNPALGCFTQVVSVLSVN